MPHTARHRRQVTWYGHSRREGGHPSLLARHYRPHGHSDELSHVEHRSRGGRRHLEYQCRGTADVSAETRSSAASSVQVTGSAHSSSRQLRLAGAGPVMPGWSAGSRETLVAKGSGRRNRAYRYRTLHAAVTAPVRKPQLSSGRQPSALPQGSTCAARTTRATDPRRQGSRRPGTPASSTGC